MRTSGSAEGKAIPFHHFWRHEADGSLKQLCFGQEMAAARGAGCHRHVAARHILSRRPAGVSGKAFQSDHIVTSSPSHCLESLKSSSHWRLHTLQLPFKTAGRQHRLGYAGFCAEAAEWLLSCPCPAEICTLYSAHLHRELFAHLVLEEVVVQVALKTPIEVHSGGCPLH